MTWRCEWTSIAARIAGLEHATELFVHALGAVGDQNGVPGRFIKPELEEIREDLQRFVRERRGALPSGAAASLEEYLSDRTHPVTNEAFEIVQMVVPLALLRSRVEYLIKDKEEESRSLTELAFEHLRRSIVVDEKLRDMWQAAFPRREENCERLGSVHLLSHGIWAFKVGSHRAATDLMYSEPLEKDAHLVRRTARALILTEWKCVRDGDNPDKKAAEAMEQMKAYEEGVLADLELSSTRYIVLVTGRRIRPPDDIEQCGVRFSHVVIPTRPDDASSDAQRLASGGVAKKETRQKSRRRTRS